ncbi:MAG: RGCVC family protein [Pseudonocardiaceae bacterium]
MQATGTISPVLFVRMYWDTHDPIGIRYCSATVAGGLHRGCVCVGNTGNEDHR